MFAVIKCNIQALCLNTYFSKKRVNEGQRTVFPNIPMFHMHNSDYHVHHKIPLRLEALGETKYVIKETDVLGWTLGTHAKLRESTNDSSSLLISTSVSFLKLKSLKNGISVGWVDDNFLVFTKVLPCVYRDIDKNISNDFVQVSYVDSWPKKKFMNYLKMQMFPSFYKVVDVRVETCKQHYSSNVIWKK